MRIRNSTNVYVSLVTVARRYSLSGPQWSAGRAEFTSLFYIYSYSDPGGRMCKTCVCGRSLAGNVGSNPTESLSARLS
jgi:hypothetical protein